MADNDKKSSIYHRLRAAHDAVSAAYHGGATLEQRVANAAESSRECVDGVERRAARVEGRRVVEQDRARALAEAAALQDDERQRRDPMVRRVADAAARARGLPTLAERDRVKAEAAALRALPSRPEPTAADVAAELDAAVAEARRCLDGGSPTASPQPVAPGPQLAAPAVRVLDAGGPRQATIERLRAESGEKAAAAYVASFGAPASPARCAPAPAPSERPSPASAVIPDAVTASMEARGQHVTAPTEAIARAAIARFAATTSAKFSVTVDHEGRVVAGELPAPDPARLHSFGYLHERQTVRSPLGGAHAQLLLEKFTAEARGPFDVTVDAKGQIVAGELPSPRPKPKRRRLVEVEDSDAYDAYEVQAGA